MLPVIVPIVQVKVLAALAVKPILGPVPLHVAAVDEFVTAGIGLIVTVIGNTEPAQLPVVDVGVTLYITLPAVALLGFVKV